MRRRGHRLDPKRRLARVVCVFRLARAENDIVPDCQRTRSHSLGTPVSVAIVLLDCRQSWERAPAWSDQQRNNKQNAKESMVHTYFFFFFWSLRTYISLHACLPSIPHGIGALKITDMRTPPTHLHSFQNLCNISLLCLQVLRLSLDMACIAINCTKEPQTYFTYTAAKHTDSRK